MTKISSHTQTFLMLLAMFGFCSASLAETEIQKQQKILEQYKPLIQARTYADLIRETEPQPPLQLNRLPSLNEDIIPGRAPNLKVIPYLLKSFAHPAYQADYRDIRYEIAVNCEAPTGFDDCSTTPHNQFKGKPVYVRFIQTRDPKFDGVKGMKIGVTYAQVEHLFSDSAEIHGDGECLQTRSGWLACFDASNLVVNKRRLQMMPRSDAPLLRFVQVTGRAY